jgi:hypothetical protein
MPALAKRRLRPYGDQIVSLQRAVRIKDQYEVIAHTLPTFRLVVTSHRETAPVACQAIGENTVDLERFVRLTQMRENLGFVDRFAFEKCEQVRFAARGRCYATRKRNLQEEQAAKTPLKCGARHMPAPR